MRKNVSILLNNKLLKEQGIGLALVFGSYVTGLKHPGSDIDIGVVFFDKSKLKKDSAEVYGSLYEEFTKAFHSEKIDIVYLEEAPLAIQHRAVNDGIVLYAQSPSFFADYKEKVIMDYLDFRFIENMFNQAILTLPKNYGSIRSA